MDNARFRIARWIIERRKAMSIMFLLVTLGFAAGLPRVDIRTIFTDLLPSDDPFVQAYYDHPNFGDPLTVTVMIKRVDGKTIFNVDTLQKLWTLTRDVDLIEGINHDRILSITTEKATFAEATADGTQMSPLMGNEVPKTDEEMIELERRVERSPTARTYLVSADRTATLLRFSFLEEKLEYDRVFAKVRELIAAADDDAHEFSLVGQPILTGWVYKLQKQTYTIFAVTVGLLIVALALYMGNVTGIVVPIVCSFVAAVWGFGMVGWLHSPIEPLLMVVPLLLVARSFSHCIQYVERYYEIYAHVRERRKASELTLAVMLVPSVLGIMTDVIAIFVIGVAPIPAMQRFALFCGMWALYLIPTGVMLIAVLLSYLPAPKNIDALVGEKSNEGGIHKIQRVMLNAMAKLTFGRRAEFTLVAVVAVTTAAIVLGGRIAIGNPVEGSNLLWEDSDFNTAVRAINDKFPGVNSLEIIFEQKDLTNMESRASRSATTYLLSQQIQKAAESAAQPARATRSFADVMEEVNRIYSGGHPAWLSIDPDEASVNAAGTSVAFGQNPLNFADMTDFRYQHSTVSLFYRDNKQDTVNNALAVARKAVAEVGEDHPNIRIRLASGTIALQESMNVVVERYHWILIGLCCLAISIIATYAYRSILAAVILLIPVLLSNYYLMGTSYLLGVGLDINSVLVTVLGVGVGIDYGIYLLSRICEEYHAQGADWGRAITQSMVTTGKAIMFTASIMLAGILPWYFLSDLKFMADMGLLLAAVMLINMVLALIVLPLLVWIIKPGFVTRTDLAVGEGIDLSQFESKAGKADTHPGVDQDKDLIALANK